MNFTRNDCIPFASLSSTVPFVAPLTEAAAQTNASAQLQFYQLPKALLEWALIADDIE